MRRLLAALVVIAVVATVAVVAWRQVGEDTIELAPRRQTCTATVGALSGTLDMEQSQNAALIVARSVRRGLPARAGTIALATAMQESKLRNIDYGDRDSLGLFQQRPSQGWGSRAEVTDPVHATDRFYDGLESLGDFRSMEITDAAQAVQRSGYPEAYAQHETSARALASALAGQSPHSLSCEIETPRGGRPGRVRRDLTEAFGERVGTPVVRGHSITLTAPDRQLGWAVAHYLLAQSERLGVSQVSYRGWSWTADESPQGWVRTDGGGVPGQVRVTVAGPSPSI